MAAVAFKDTITLGSIIVGFLIGLSGLAVFFYGVKWKSAYLVAEANAEAWHATSDRLERELDELRGEITTLRARLAELEALPDVAAVHRTLVRHDEATAQAMRQHDANAEKRAVRLIEAIQSLPQGGTA